MPYKLLALDLDGTLLDEQCRIPATTVEKLRLAQEKGVVVTLATGRMWVSTRTYATDLQISHPLITYNGALIRDAHGRETLYESLVSAELIRDLIAYCKSEQLYLQLYGNDEIVIEKRVAETEIDPDLKFASCRELGDFTAYLARPDTTALAGSPKMMIAVTRDRVDQIPRIRSELQTRFPELNVVQSRPWLLEILSPGVSKAAALEILAKSLGISRDEAIAVGDSDNDISMVSWAGLGAAVQNATPELVKVAKYLASAPSYRGVEEIIDKFIL